MTLPRHAAGVAPETRKMTGPTRGSSGWVAAAWSGIRRPCEHEAPRGEPAAIDLVPSIWNH